MNVNYEYPVMVFRKDNQYGTTYSVGLSKRKQDGTYENGYMPIRFKKVVELQDKTKIFIKNAFLTFYIGGNPKRTMPYIMCTEYDVAEFKKIEKTNSEIVKEAMQEKDSFEEFGEQLQLTDDDLPF